ncbi:hypothetical protein [Haloferula rosea]|uniref:Uncharacterized protein n=1 Tax=Haloferula rosea TaxID=490093 RepID=A0A934RAC5_9BACT|nr:hypothetical protein [Haloferula rosea]MBK1828059.1 hypothetical protein [Haloferula rosea]
MSEDQRTSGGGSFNARQLFFVRYFALVLTDIVVLNLFEEHWGKVTIPSFTISIGAALLLQLLLKLTVAAEHKVAGFFSARTHRGAKALKIFALWLVLFGSKFVILWALGFAFGDKVHFEGKMHGVVPLIIVIVVILFAEMLVLRLTDFLGRGKSKA